MSFIARQPNGLLCRHSSVVDCVTDYNMTDKECIDLQIQRAKEQAERDTRMILEKYLKGIEEVKESFIPNNMSKKEFNKILKDMEKPAEECRHIFL